MAYINEFFNAISHKKENIFSDNEFMSDYTQYIINRIFSFFPDTVLIANEMNIRSFVSDKNHFRFMMEFIPKRKRKQVFARKNNNNALKMVADCYNISLEKAEIYLKILSSEQIQYIEMISDTGGKTKK